MSIIKGIRSNRVTLALWFLVPLFLSCNTASLDRDKYASFVADPDNGLVQRQDFDELSVEIFYQPLEYVYLKERKGQNTSKEDFEAWKIDHQNFDYYILRLRNDNTKEIAEYKSGSYEEYSNKLDYLVAGLQDDINVVSGKDTMPCSLFHYERNFGLSGNNNFNLVFPRDTSKNDRSIIIDLGVFEVGKVKFKFNKEALSDIPKLII